KIYELPSEDELNERFPFAHTVAQINRNTNTDYWFTHDVEQIYELKDSFLIFGKAILDRQPTYGQQVFIELRDGKTGQTLTFDTRQTKRYDTNPYFRKYNLDYAGFMCRIKKEQLGDAEYTINMSIINGDLFRREPTDQKIKKTY